MAKLSDGDLAAMLEVKGKYARPAQLHPWLKSLSLLAVALGLVGMCAAGLLILRKLAWLVDTNDWVAGGAGVVLAIVFALTLSARR